VDWLLDCLEIGDVIIDEAADIQATRTVTTSSTSGSLPQVSGPTSVQTFVLNPEAREAAEGYLEARYQMYRTVYLYKTTRSAEAVLGILLRRLAATLKEREPESLKLSPTDPVVRFLTNPSVTAAEFLAMDDIAVWGLARSLSEHCPDAVLQQLANRLIDRKLYKCLMYDHRAGESDWPHRFEMRLRKEASRHGLEYDLTVMVDRPRVRGYDWVDFGDAGSLRKILIWDKEREENIDLGDHSEIVQALRKQDFFRIYVPGQAEMGVVRTLETGGLHDVER
jgi:HD superfamily phosphohydrolase